MKRTSIVTFMACIASLILNGCAYNCACDEILPSEQDRTSTLHPIPEGAQLMDECAYIKEGIADSISFSEKFSKSRYAIYYQAVSRERVSELEARAKEISCP